MTSPSTPSSTGGQRAHGRRRRTLLVATGGLVLGGLVTGAAAFLGGIPAAAGAALASALLAKKAGEGLSAISMASVVEGLAGTAMAVWLSHAVRPRPGDVVASHQAAWLADRAQHIELRERAATARERAASARERAATDREQAAAERERAAAERERAAAERERAANGRERKGPAAGSVREPPAPAPQPAEGAARQRD